MDDPFCAQFVPDEILCEIVAHLSLFDRAYRIQFVSRRWRRCAWAGLRELRLDEPFPCRLPGLFFHGARLWSTKRSDCQLKPGGSAERSNISDLVRGYGLLGALEARDAASIT